MFSVQSDLLKGLARLDALTHGGQMAFAAASAITSTAYEVQTEVRRNMPQRFTLRRQWIVQGIRVDKATKQSLTATVYSRDKFMGLQEAGGVKSPLRNYIAVPTKAVRRTKTQLIAKSDLPAALGDKVAVVEYNGDKYLALKKARKGANKGGQLRLLYLLVPRANLHQRLGLEKDGRRVARERFGPNFSRAIERAIRTAR